MGLVWKNRLSLRRLGQILFCDTKQGRYEVIVPQEWLSLVALIYLYMGMILAQVNA